MLSDFVELSQHRKQQIFFFIIFFFYFIYVWLHWIFIAASDFSLVAMHVLVTGVASLVAAQVFRGCSKWT